MLSQRDTTCKELPAPPPTKYDYGDRRNMQATNFSLFTLTRLNKNNTPEAQSRMMESLSEVRAVVQLLISFLIINRSPSVVGVNRCRFSLPGRDSINEIEANVGIQKFSRKMLGKQASSPQLDIEL